MSRTLVVAALIILGVSAVAARDMSGDAFAPAVAAGDVAKGETFAKRCAACHTFESGGPNKVGPNLWGIVGRPVATHADFKYSDAMIEFSAGGSKIWTYDELNAYLENPKKHIPGNKMIFPGAKKEEDRANVIAYLRTLSDTPAPLPSS
jgi:cytochrome c